MAVLGNRVVKSVQKGTDVLVDQSSESITITAVDLSKASLNLIGAGPMRRTSGTSLEGAGIYAYLANTTTITTYSYQSVYRGYYSWEVVEYE